jgi:glycosyltransferase involved in cell wall biosynthesis
MRILMPSIVDPGAFAGGAWTMTRGLVQLLRSQPLGADVDVVAPPRRSVVTHAARRGLAIAKSLVTGVPAKIEFVRGRRVRREVQRRIAADSPDLVILNGSDLLWLLPDLPDETNRIVVAHNIEHQLFAAQLGRLDGFASVARAALQHDCDALRRFELDGLKSARRIVCLSSDDERYVRAECAGVETMTLPPVFDGPRAPRRTRPPDARTIDVGMVANFHWWPNRDGLAWFVERVLPNLGPSIRVHLFGHGSVHAAPRDDRVIAHGFVPRIDDIYASCDFVMCPIRAGSGVSIKLAEALYHGVPVLATPFASRGIDLDAGAARVLLDEPSQWVEFLNDAGAEFASQIVAPAVSAHFHVSRHAGRLAQFIRTDHLISR